MSFWSTLKSIFGTPKQDDAELKELRAKHGIAVEDPHVEERKRAKEKAEAYNPWDEVRNMRTNFFMGAWASRKFNIVGEDKVKKQLDELAKQREADRKQKEEEKLK